MLTPPHLLQYQFLCLLSLEMPSRKHTDELLKFMQATFLQTNIYILPRGLAKMNILSGYL